MSENRPDSDREEDDAARRSALRMIAAAFVVVLIGGWLVYALHDYLATERCHIEGHRYCDGPPVEIPR
ncbi:MAG: hypothetical protein ACTHLR_12735 [Rhizomicrobium sp.]